MEYKHKYRIFTIMIGLILCIVIIYYVNHSFDKIGETYRSKIPENLITMGIDPDTAGALTQALEEEEQQLLSKMKLEIKYLLLGSLIVAYVVVFTFEGKYHADSKKQLKNEVIRDPLTGLLNRRGGILSLKKTFEGFKYGDFDVAIMLFDIDNFKRINDTYGHALGDIALLKSVEIVRNNIRNMDKLIRWGGDEFVVIFKGLHPDNIHLIGNKIISDMAEMKIHPSSDIEIVNPTISMGFSMFKNSDINYNKALERADEALYHAKAQGKNTFHIKL